MALHPTKDEGLADTSDFIAHEGGRSLRSDLLPDRLAVSVITVNELRAGVLAAADLATRDRRLATLWIAATAIALDVPLVTQDDGYVDVPSLRVIRI